MALNRQELINYCLRKLGNPVLHINVAPEQIEDRVDEALQFFAEYHADAVQKSFIKRQITASHLQLNENIAQSYHIGETVTGSVSGASLKVYDTPELNKIRTLALNGTPIDGETFTGSISGVTSTMAAGGFYIGDIQKKSIPLPDDVLSVMRVFPIDGSKLTADFLFDVRYQIMLNDVFNINQAGLNYYSTVQQHIALLDFLLTVQTSTTFNRHTGELLVHTDWANKILPDYYMIIQGIVSINPQENTRIYNDIFLKKYCTALIKQQWAQNLSKYQEIELIGGVKLNASAMMAEALTEIKDLEDNIMNKFSEPLGFMMG